jgi:tetratricopeptide (TPR) repeat protein
MTAARRYVAFVSYSHVDRKVARWLHRSIEGYRLPARLRETAVDLGRRDGRLAPVFLDREDLPSSTDLAESVRIALAESDAMIVVCSPHAARSRWVDEEIRLFKAMGRDHRIMCLVVGGEPRAAEKGLPAEQECLPPALRYVVDADGVVTDRPAPEPLAADLRRGGDTRRDAKLKLVAGLLGTGLDELRQRDQMRRQRQLVAVGAASTIGCIAFAGLAFSAFMQRNEAERQRRLAEQKSLTAERTADFMISLFRVSDPSEARGNAVTAREILDRGARQIDESLREEPLVRADLSVVLGEVYTGLGLYTPAAGLLEAAGRIDGQSDIARLRQTVALAELEFQRGNDARADELLAQAQQLAFDERSPASPMLRARILLDRGDVASFMERDEDAKGFFEQALELGQQHGLGDVTPRALEGIALAQFYGGDIDQAQRAYENALDVRIRRSGETHPKVSESLTALGSIAYMQDRPDEAEKYWLQSLAVDRRILGDRHPDVAVTLNNLGRLDVERRNFVRAKERLGQSVSIYAAGQSETHEGRIFAWTNLALADIGLGQFEAAAALLHRALDAAVATKHRLEGPILTDLADLECRTRRFEEGLARLDAARRLVAQRYPDEHWRTALVDNVRAGCLARAGRAVEAEYLVVSSMPALMDKWPAESYYGHDSIQRAKQVYTMTGNRTELAEVSNLLSQDVVAR